MKKAILLLLALAVIGCKKQPNYQKDLNTVINHALKEGYERRNIFINGYEVVSFQSITTSIYYVGDISYNHYFKSNGIGLVCYNPEESINFDQISNYDFTYKGIYNWQKSLQLVYFFGDSI